MARAFHDGRIEEGEAADMQQPPILASVIRMLADLRREVVRDSWSLTRDDHDAIELKINELEQFIRDRYAQRAAKLRA